MTFQDLGLEPMLLKAVTEMGFENPTPIQEQTIPQLKDKSTDMVALAQTGTGKTAAFGLPLLQKLDLNSRFTQSLILAPTRELCVQISKDLINFCNNGKPKAAVLPVPVCANATMSVDLSFN